MRHIKDVTVRKAQLKGEEESDFFICDIFPGKDKCQDDDDNGPL